MMCLRCSKPCDQRAIDRWLPASRVIAISGLGGDELFGGLSATIGRYVAVQWSCWP